MNKIFLETSSKNSYECSLIRTLLELQGLTEGSDFELVYVGGKDNLPKYSAKLAEHESDTEVNLIIFDADTQATGGGHSIRFNELKQILDSMDKISNKSEIFLFPNNKDDGILENLLEQIINPEHRCILKYFAAYEDSLASHKNEHEENKYEVPDQKTRMFAYISAFKKTRKQREDFKNKGNWMFSNPEIWNLNAAALQPLREFLKKNLSQ